MSALDLVFSRPVYAGGSIDLVFGDDGGSAPILPLTADITVMFGSTVVQATAAYDNRLPHTVSAARGLRHQVAVPAEAQAIAAWVPPTHIDHQHAAQWQAATSSAGAPATGWNTTAPVQHEARVRGQSGTTVSAAVRLVHQVCTPVEVLKAIGWQGSIPLAVSLLAPHQVAHGLQVAPLLRLQQGQTLARALLAPHQVATPAQRALVARWQRAQAIPTGRTIYVPTGGEEGEGREISLDLVFACPAYEGGPVDLVFGHVCMPPVTAGIVIPVRSCYVVHNSVTLYRLPAGTEFKAESFTLDIDKDSWTFGWSASLHSSARAHLLRSAPDERVEVECVVNGVSYRLAIDSMGRDKSFPESRIAVRGLGRAAELDDVDLSFGNTAPRTAQQLMDDVLTVNGVSLGWTLDWQIQDWLVAADAFLFRGSYIGALRYIAEAARAYIHPHTTDKVLRVLPLYPQAPWDWATLLTPDIELPAAVAAVVNVEEVMRPRYNRVFVGGVGKGVFGPVDRTGTAGDKVAPQVLHPLITAAEAHIQCGRGVLSDTGLQEHFSVQTMVLPETGIILPGKVLRFVDEDGPHLGIVRNTAVKMPEFPMLSQTLVVETHVE